MNAEPPPKLGRLWDDFERKASGYLTIRDSVLAMAAGAGIWMLWLGVVTPTVRFSASLLGLCVAIAAGYGAVEVLRWRHWRAWWLFRWVYKEQARLHATDVGGDVAVGRQVDRLMSDAVPGSAAWPEIRSLAVHLGPAARENVLLLADIVEGRSHDSAKLKSAIVQLADDEERRYWTARLGMTEGFAAYRLDGDYMRPLIDAGMSAGRAPGFLLAVVRRFVLTWIWLGVGLILALVIIGVWNA